MDIKPTGKDAAYTNIFRMGVKGTTDYLQYGARQPAIWFLPRSNKLHMSAAVSGSPNRYFNSAELPMNKFTNIVIQQRRQYGERYRLVSSLISSIFIFLFSIVSYQNYSRLQKQSVFKIHVNSYYDY